MTTANESPGFTEELITRAFANQLDVPVMVMVGTKGFLIAADPMGAFRPDQRQAFANAPRLRTLLIPGTGHDLALHRNADHSNAIINRWAVRLARAPRGLTAL